MAFFNKLFNIPEGYPADIDNVELAYQLLLGDCTIPLYRSTINKLLKECTEQGQQYPDKQKILLKVIELTGNPDTPKQRFLLATAYAQSRVQYRVQAIHYLELYLSNSLWEDAFVPSKKYHLKEMNEFLAKAYMGEYEFDKALEVYNYLINIIPDSPSPYMGKCEVLIKQNKLQECLVWLLNCKKLPYYKFNQKYLETAPENWFYYTINRLTKDVELKIEKRLCI